MQKGMFVTMFGCLLIATSAVAQEQNASPMPVEPGAAVTPQVVSANHTLKKTIISFSGGGASLPAGYQPIDAPTTITCPGSTGNCMITVDQNVQVSGEAPNNQWAICTQVDGVFMNEPPCGYLGLVQTHPEARTFQQSDTTVSAGAHTVQTFIFTVHGGLRGIYHLTYKIYKP